MTILQHEPAAAPKKVFLPCVSLPRANFYENIFYNVFALKLSYVGCLWKINVEFITIFWYSYIMLEELKLPIEQLREDIMNVWGRL